MADQLWSMTRIREEEDCTDFRLLILSIFSIVQTYNLCMLHSGVCVCYMFSDHLECLLFMQNLSAKMLVQITEHYDGRNTTTLLSRGGFTRNDINVAVVHEVCSFSVYF